MTASKSSKLGQLNIVASCRIMKSVIDYSADKIKLVEVARCIYAPKTINQTLKQHNLTKATWVICPTGRELWIAKDELAKQL